MESTPGLKWYFKGSERNPEWSIDKMIILRSCLLRNKASRNINTNDIVTPDVFTPPIYASKVPKWLTTLSKPSVDTDTGELFYDDYLTDDFGAALHRKIKTVNKFCDFYDPLFTARKVSLLFHTFTRIEYSRQDMRTMLECVKSRYKSLKRPIRGYLWVLEVSANLHIHYHLVIAIDRYKVNKIPPQLKFEDLWGQRTGVEFIKKGIRRYLSGYLKKSEIKLMKFRSYAISRNLI